MKWLRKTYVAIVMAFLYAPILVLIVFPLTSQSRAAPGRASRFRGINGCLQTKRSFSL